MLDVLAVAGFLFSAVIVYFAVCRLAESLDPYTHETRTDEHVWKIAVSDIVFLHEITPYLKKDGYTVYTGSTREILDDSQAAGMDALILVNEAGEGERPDMNILEGRYYSSSVSLRLDGAQLNLLTRKPRSVIIYYRRGFRSILDAMIHQGILVPVKDEDSYV